jgi:hypothetical protein
MLYLPLAVLIYGVGSVVFGAVATLRGDALGLVFVQLGALLVVLAELLRRSEE